MKKIIIELTPYTALAIHSFLSEFEPEMNADKKWQSLKDAHEEFKNEFFKKASNEQIDDAIAEARVHELLERSPTACKSCGQYVRLNENNECINCQNKRV